MEEVARWRETAAKNDGGESSSQNTRKSRKHLCTKENVSTESQNKIVNEYASVCARMCVCMGARVRSRVRARRREGRTRGALSRHRVSRQTAWQLLDLFIRLAYLATYIRTSLCTAGSRSNKHPALRAKYRLYLWTRPSNLSIRITNANSNLCSPGSRSKYPGLTPGSLPSFYDLWRGIRTEGEIVGIGLRVVAEVGWKRVRSWNASMYCF